MLYIIMIESCFVHTMTLYMHILHYSIPFFYLSMLLLNLFVLRMLLFILEANTTKIEWFLLEVSEGSSMNA